MSQSGIFSQIDELQLSLLLHREFHSRIAFAVGTLFGPLSDVFSGDLLLSGSDVVAVDGPLEDG